MSALRWLTDWRGAPDLTKVADYYSVGPYFSARPTLGNPNGKVFVYTSATVLMTPEGKPSPVPYYADLYAAAVMRGALTNRVVWSDTNGYHTLLLDLTKKRFLLDFLIIVLKHFAWADGFHFDYFSTWSWLFLDLTLRDAAWDEVLWRAANWLRNHNKLVVGQQFHLTTPVMATNGLFVEISPTYQQYTTEKHAADCEQFRSETAPREIVWVQEIRYPQDYDAVTLQAILSWAETNGMAVALGRDATAQGV